MDFSNCIFIFIFFPISCIVFYLTPKRLKKYSLLLLSLAFLTLASWRSLVVILISTVLSYVIGLMIEKYHKRYILILGIILNVLLLIFFKYTNFIFANINKIFSTQIKSLKLVLPLGISFFTFQIISYLVDVYKKKIKAEKNIVNYLLYICFFPRVLQGPIIRYEEFKKNIDEYKKPNLEETVNGLERISFGLGKVVILSNTMGNIWNEIYGANVSTLTAWLGIICYSLYLYLNFSGYIDISLGIGKIFGIKLPENFNYPYVSASISEFWRRWHISLSNWFRDYIYIPLGGNRTGNVYFNLFVVFLVTGIWHGASWNFIFWGIYNGFWIILERLIRDKKAYKKIPKIALQISTYIIIILGWVLFASNGIREAIRYYMNMFGIRKAEYIQFSLSYYLTPYNLFYIGLSALIATAVPKRIIEKSKNLKEILTAIAALCILVVSIVFIVNNNYSPSIYAQF